MLAAAWRRAGPRQQVGSLCQMTSKLWSLLLIRLEVNTPARLAMWGKCRCLRTALTFLSAAALPH